MLPEFPSSGYLVPPVLGFLVFSGLTVYSLRFGRGQAVNLLFAVLCLMGAMINADLVAVSVIADPAVALIVDRVSCVAFVFGPPVFLQFVHAFLGIRSRRKWEIGVYGISAAFSLTVPSPEFISEFHESPFGRIGRAGAAFHSFSVFAIAVIAYVLFLLVRSLHEAADAFSRHRIRYVLGGAGTAVALLGLNVLPVWGLAIYPPGHFSFIPAAFLAYGALKYDLLGVGSVVRRGAVYLLLTAMLASVYFLLISALHFFFMTASWERSLLLPLGLALLVVFLFHPLKTLLERLVDRFLFRGRYDYRELLRDLSGQLASMLNLSAIRSLLIGTALRSLRVRCVKLLLDGQPDGSFALYASGCGQADAEPQRITIPASLMHLFLQRGKPLSRAYAEKMCGGHHGRMVSLFDRLGAVWIFPLLSKGMPVGFLALGEKMSGELFVREDIELLSTLANQAATAIENARIYEEIERLNQDLEGQVARRTEALQRALEEKERTQKQLIVSESLAAIGQLVAGTAHELNNPLASASSLIQTSLEAIEDGGVPTAGDVQDDLRFAHRELQRAADIVRSLLSLSRQTRAYEESVQVNRVLDDALRVLHNQLKNLPVEVEKRYDGALPEIRGNFANLGQVFINLIKNAIQAVEGKTGRIVLTTGLDPSGTFLFVEIADNGAGIPEDVQKDIFKPFFTTKTVGEGTGLGLYISHEIVRRHGGSIAVHSEENCGSAFTVTIPVRR
ncbi:MAG: Sensor protein ZraS [Syntrophaceae bacterium PtaU1.Bin231]|nr:MAG: Sensor protein ZraS [Syntrophaceae bacterium PtaU1.Bin231]